MRLCSTPENLVAPANARANFVILGFGVARGVELRLLNNSEYSARVNMKVTHKRRK